MKILLSGASGLLGTALEALLREQGYRVLRLVRRAAMHPDEVSWYPNKGLIETERLEALDAVIHLAGESIAGSRWDDAFKQKLLNSRVQGTALLTRALCELTQKPAVLVSASAIGIYGDRGEQWLDESDSAGNGFLSEVCRQWESAAEAVEHCGIRRVSARIGLVLSAQGGALSKMLLPFQLGLGGELGNGKQYLSWISREDTIRALLHCVQTPSLQGPVNLCAPMPVSNREFTRVLGRVLHRPALFKVPAVALKLGMGAEMAQELLLASARVKPTQLLNSGFVFRYPELEAALRQSLGK